MASKLIILSHAQTDFEQLPKKEQRKVYDAIQVLKEFPLRKTGVRKLKPPFFGFRKRAGSYRVLFDFEDGTVFVRRIKHRKDAYR